MSEIRMVPVDRIDPDPKNSRKQFDPGALDELSASIKAHGVLEPLLARPGKGTRYSLIAGERRLRAAKLAKLTEVPVIVHDVDETTAATLQAIENVQRQDLEPWEEMQAYERLQGMHPEWDDEQLAIQVKKDRSYVRQRLQLRQLIPDALKALQAGTIMLPHALLIARLQPADQKTVLGAAATISQWTEKGQVKGPAPVKALAAWITKNVLMDLHGAPFKKDDPHLVETAGPCGSCPKRTGAQQSLWPDVTKGDTCTDRHCFNAKLEAHIKRRLVETPELLQVHNSYEDKKSPFGGTVLSNRAWREAGKKGKSACAHSRPAIIPVESHDLRGGVRLPGRELLVCAEKSCKVHFGHGGGSDDKYAAQIRAKQKAAERKRRMKLEFGRRLFQHVKTAEGSVAEPLRILTEALVHEMTQDALKLACGAFGLDIVKKKHPYGGTTLDPATPITQMFKALPYDQVERSLLTLACASDLVVPTYNPDAKPERLIALAEQLGVDHAGLLKTVAGEFAEKDKKRREREKKAKKVSAKAAPPADDESSLEDDSAVEHPCEECRCVESRACPGGCAWDPRFLKMKPARYVCTTCADQVWRDEHETPRSEDLG